MFLQITIFMCEVVSKVVNNILTQRFYSRYLFEVSFFQKVAMAHEMVFNAIVFLNCLSVFYINRVKMSSFEVGFDL